MDGGSLQITGLTKQYSGVKVVSEVSLTIPSGQFFSLLGPSGSGKTTTLMMVAGFADPDGGRIAFKDRDITHLPPQHRNFGMVFQNYALFPHLSVAQNVAFPLQVRGEKKAVVAERVAWALDVVRLTGFEARLPGALSGGQQQRVALARAVVYEPPIVLMDEPLGALDKNLRYQMQVEIKEIQKRLGMTVIYVTHDQEEAMNMSDMIAIMNHGQVEQMGVPTEVYEHPSSIFAGKFLGEANLIVGDVNGSGPRTLTHGEVRFDAARSIVDPTLTSGGRHFIRPEKIGIDKAGKIPGNSGDLNRVIGTVRRVSFLGHLVRYGVDIGADDLLTVDAHNNGDHVIFADGEDVAAAWHPRDSVLYHHG
ncbi:MAG: ABC transporter ATP-binding protein [Pseudomonadota bacterium]